MRKLFFITIMVIAVWAAPMTVLADEATTITILHTNDIHGRFVESNTAIGMDTIAAIHAATPNSILVDAGDTFHGMPFVNFNDGLNAVLLMNMAGYDFMAPGNHEFNFSADRLMELEAIADFEFLAANLLRQGAAVFTPYSIVEVDGVTLGFFGLVYPGTPVVTHPDNVIGLDFGDPIAAARQAVTALQEHDVDIIIALAHLGVDGSAYSHRVAQAVPEIDLIVDGHSHTLFEDGYQAGDVLIVQSGAHATHLGRVDIVIAGGEVSSITASVITQEYALENFEPVVEIMRAIDQMNAELGEVLDIVVGYSPVTFYGDSPDHRAYLRSQEVPIGNLVADSMRWATGADLTIVNSGGIRYHIHAGEVTKGDIIEVLAFFNYAVVVEITPVQLREALENSVSNMPGNGRFPQVSGLSFVFDEYAGEGARVLSITVAGELLDLEDTTTTFSLAINNFMAAGGDGYSVLSDLPRIGEFGTQDELLIAYMEVADLTTVAVEGRITNVAGQVQAEPEPVAEPEPIAYEPEPVAEPAPTPLPTVAAPGTGTVVNCWYLNVREAGSPQADAIGLLRVGTVVNILETNDWNWHRIQTSDIQGWVYGGYIELN